MEVSIYWTKLRPEQATNVKTERRYRNVVLFSTSNL